MTLPCLEVTVRDVRHAATAARGDALGDRLDVVADMHGLGRFADELVNAKLLEIDRIPFRVLSLDRIIESKRAANRPRDLAAIPALEEALAALSAVGND